MIILDFVSCKYFVVYVRCKSIYSWIIEKKKMLVEKVVICILWDCLFIVKVIYLDNLF